MKKTFIKFLEDYGYSFYACGIIEAGTVYTDNEFIQVFGCEAYDDIRDCFCDNIGEGKVEMWQNGMHVLVWEE